MLQYTANTIASAAMTVKGIQAFFSSTAAQLAESSALAPRASGEPSNT